AAAGGGRWALDEGGRGGEGRGRENGDREGGRRRPSPPHESPNPAGEQEDDERIERQQTERSEQDQPAQIPRLARSISLAARVERGNIERREPVSGCKRVHGEQPFRRSVKAWRGIGGAPGPRRPRPPRGA